MDFIKKRKFNSLLQGIGARSTTSHSSSSSSTPNPPADASDLDHFITPSTPPSNRNSAAPLDSTSSTIRTPGSDSTTMRHSASTIARPSNNVLSELDLTKRRRVGVPGSTPAKDTTTPLSFPSSTSHTTISNIRLRKWSGNDEKSFLKPRFCPGDRDELLKRLASFQELTDWTPKPDRVNEVEWAKRGWVCQGKERVRCTLCSKELVVKLNRKEVDGKEVAVLVPSEIEDALVDKYVELIVESHQEDCLWRKRGCDDSLLRLPLANPKQALEGLRARYDELCARKDFLPYGFNIRLPANLDINRILSQLPPTFFTEPAPPATNPSTPNRTALALAVTGWQGLTNPRIGPVPNTASCHTCLRRLGLWMFKSKEVDLETNTVLVEAPMDHLDPVREHRFFCPWRNAEAQRNPGGGTPRKRVVSAEDEDKPGYDILLQVLKNDDYLRNRGKKTSHHRSVKSADVRPSTPLVLGSPNPLRKSMAVEGGDSPVVLGDDGEEIVGDEKAEQAVKDKERWARLRRVKSLFDTKGSRKLRKSLTVSRPGSRPGTAASSTQGPE